MPQPINLATLLVPGRVVVLPGTPSKALVISALADVATADLAAHDRIQFIRGVLEREDVTTTAIGGGIAIPHARTPALVHCRVAIGILPGGIAWGASDGRPVHLALLIAARESDHTEHLRLMAALAVRMHNPGLVERMRVLTDHDEIVRTILA